MIAQNSTSDASKNQPKIRIIKNGPYFVKGAVSVSKRIIRTDAENTAIEWQIATEYPLTESCSLCRCGQSKNKPYCDGTHAIVGFDGSETADKETYLEKPKEIQGPVLNLIDVEELCASARFCHRDGGIWNLVPRTDNSKVYWTVVEEAANCPSGRLILKEKKTSRLIEPQIEKSIWLVEDPTVGVSGPIWARGGIPVESADGKIYRIRNRVTLCRCGKSQNKPFCDSSHYPEEHEPHEQEP